MKTFNKLKMALIGVVATSITNAQAPVQTQNPQAECTFSGGGGYE